MHLYINCMYRCVCVSVGEVTWSSPSAVELTSPTPAQCRAVMDHKILRDICLKVATNECVEEIFQRMSTSLKTLLVIDSTVTADNMATLFTSLVRTNVQINLLEFDSCILDNRAVQILSAALRRNTSIQTLCIIGRITDTALAFSKALLGLLVMLSP